MQEFFRARSKVAMKSLTPSSKKLEVGSLSLRSLRGSPCQDLSEIRCLPSHVMLLCLIILCQAGSLLPPGSLSSTLMGPQGETRV